MSTLSFPQIREAPATVVRGLRAVDPRTAVLWWGPTIEVEDQPVPGRQWATRPVSVTKPAWLIGIVDPYRVGNLIAAARCRRYHETPLLATRFESSAQFAQRAHQFRQRNRLARLSYQGFVPKFFWYARDLDGELVLEYQAMAWFAEHLFETTLRRAVKDSELEGVDLTIRQQMIRDVVRATMPGIWRHTFRGRRSFLVPEKTKGVA